MKTIAISGSPRQKGNTERLLAKALEGAREQGHETQLYRLEDMNVHGCRGCMACFQKGACIHVDDMTPLYRAIMESNHVILGSPVYMMQMTSQLKTCVDRFMCFINPDFSSRLPKGIRISLFFSYGSAPQELVMPYVENTMQAMKIIGFTPGDLLISGGNYPADAVAGKPEILEKAYRIGCGK